MTPSQSRLTCSNLSCKVVKAIALTSARAGARGGRQDWTTAGWQLFRCKENVYGNTDARYSWWTKSSTSWLIGSTFQTYCILRGLNHSKWQRILTVQSMFGISKWIKSYMYYCLNIMDGYISLKPLGSWPSLEIRKLIDHGQGVGLKSPSWNSFEVTHYRTRCYKMMDLESLEDIDLDLEVLVRSQGMSRFQLKYPKGIQNRVPFLASLHHQFHQAMRFRMHWYHVRRRMHWWPLCLSLPGQAWGRYGTSGWTVSETESIWISVVEL